MLNVFYLPLVCQGFCASKKCSQGCVFLYTFLLLLLFVLLFPVQKSQNFFSLKKKFFFKEQIIENPVVLIPMNYTIR